MDSFWRILRFNNESNIGVVANGNNLDAADQPIEEAICKSNINMEMDNIDAVDGVESIDVAIQAAINNESNSNMEIDDVADRNIQAAINNGSHTQASPNNGSKKRPREIVESIGREVEFVAGKRQWKRLAAAIKLEVQEEKIKLLKQKYKEVYAEKEKVEERKKVEKEKEEREKKEAYLEMHKEKLRKKNLNKEIAKEYRKRRIEKDNKENQKRKDEKAAENRKCTKPYRSPLECEWNYECPWGCGYVHLNRATKCMKSNCCFNGKLSPLGDSDYFKRYGDLEPLSDEMRDMLIDNIEHIGPLSSTYGNVLSLAAIGVENGNKATGVKNTHPGGFENRGNGAPDCVTMYGRTFHYLTVARDLASGIGGLGYWVFDHYIQEALSNHIDGINANKKNSVYFVHAEIALFLRDQLLITNPYCSTLNFVGKYIQTLEDENGLDYLVKNQKTLTASLKSQVDYFDVAHITVDRATGGKVLTVALKGGETGYCDINSREYEPLSYPLFYQYGELGWGEVDSAYIPYNKYLASRLLKPELKSYEPNPYTGGPDFLTAPHQSDYVDYGYIATNKYFNFLMNDQFERHINANRFQLCPRLMQTFAVDMVSRSIDRKLNFIVRNQDSILMKDKNARKEIADIDNDSDSDDDDDDDDDDDEEENDGSEQKPDKVFLPSSLHGSPRHRKKLALNALSIVTELGKPTLFITGTVNVNWPEIKSRLLKGQTAFDRPDIVTQVFRCRLTKLIDNLKAGKYYGGRKLDYIIYCIEYQWRGLPHFHMAIKLQDVQTDTEAESIAFIDEHIKAEMPKREDYPNMSDGKFNSYLNLVKKQMKHDCAAAANGCKSKKSDFCRRGYDRTDPVLNSFIDEDGFPQYRRRNEEDYRVIAHNPDMLLDWDGHLNVEFSSTAKQILYMFKYLYKGVKKQIFLIEEDNDEKHEDNEISLYLKGRVLCSMDAFWRILGFHTYPRPNPSVKSVKVRMPQQLQFIYSQLKNCQLLLYFARPPPLFHLKYTDFFNTYRVDSKLPKRYANRRHLQDTEFYNIIIHNKELFIFPRQRKNTITRMEMCYLNHGEIFYLRLILLKRNVISFDDALLDEDGKMHETFQSAAIAWGFVHHVQHCIDQFAEFALISHGKQLRSYFSLMMAHGFPMWPIWQDKIFKEKLMTDYPDNENKLLQDLERLLQKEGTSLERFGFPMPTDMDTELEIEKLKYNPEKQAELLARLELAYPRNDEQEVAFHEIMNTVKKFQSCNRDQIAEHEFIFLGAPGGAGKTTLFKQCQAACRAEGVMIQCCAATTLAALLFDGATTAHSLFKYPVVEESDIDPEFMPQCKLDNTERLALLMETMVIFWDEFPSNDRELFEAVIRKLEQKTKYKFIFVCAGDFHQILPVVKYGSKQDVIDALIKSSPYWSKFHKIYLVENMRVNGLLNSLTNDSTVEEIAHVMDQQKYANFLVDMSKNRQGESLKIIYKNDDDTFKIGLPEVQYFQSDHPEDAIEWLYHNKEFNPKEALNTVILSSTNESVDKWNTKIQQMNPKQSKKYESRDSFDEVDDEKDILKNILSDNIKNNYNANGVPTHIVEFKVDDICLVLRSLPSLDLATNTRVQVIELLNHSIKVKTLNEPKTRYICIPRITFKFRLNYGESYQLTRVQIPLRLAYSMTFNKSQSQTLHKVLIDCTGEPFAHGHAYVAFSRVRNCQNVRVFVNEDQLHENGTASLKMMPVITNIVYQEVINDVNIDYDGVD